jgi:hypothetical protein
MPFNLLIKRIETRSVFCFISKMEGKIKIFFYFFLNIKKNFLLRLYFINFFEYNNKLGSTSSSLLFILLLLLEREREIYFKIGMKKKSRKKIHIF